MPVSHVSAAASKSALELGGSNMGFLNSVEGGGVFGDVTNVILGSDLIARKHLGPAQYEEFAIQFGFSMATALYDWIAKSWTDAPERKNGSVIVTDNKLRSQTQRDFINALITETTIPALDAASKEASSLTLKFASERINAKKSSGSTITKPAKEKQFVSANFRLEIAGLDCTRVSRIESFTVKRSTFTVTSGGDGIPHLLPGRLDIPNLDITLSEAGAQDWLSWADDFIVKGNNGNTNEKNGSLTLLAPNLKTELARISFFNLGICRLSPEKTGANAIRRIKAELYCEHMEFKVS